jgi:hypothetical protein
VKGDCGFYSTRTVRLGHCDRERERERERGMNGREMEKSERESELNEKICG